MTNESRFQPVRTRRGFEAVCDRIREQLMSGELKPGDHPHRWPFASFSRQGCSWWLAEQLERALQSRVIIEQAKGVIAVKGDMTGPASAQMVLRDPSGPAGKSMP